MEKPEVIFENQDYVAFNKPSGWLTIPDRYDADKLSLAVYAGKKYDNIFVVHRIDKATSGVVCFARNEAAHRYLSAKLMTRDVIKIYHAVVAGKPLKEKDSLTFAIRPDSVRKGKMQVHPKGKVARTDYEIVETWKHYSLLKVQIFTGRTHQIRVHLNHIGYPIVADPFYGSGEPFYLSSVKPKYKMQKWQESENPVLERLALHASALEFTDVDGSLIAINAPMAKDIEVVLKQLRKWDALP